jgi:hypothetical protein
VGLCVLANQRWWSLHGLYLARLRHTFSTRQDPGDGHATRCRKAEDEPLLHEYLGASGPELLVCASAQRRDRTGTGVPAVSFVFSAESIVLYDHLPRKDGTLQVRSHPIPSGDYAERLSQEASAQPSAASAVSGAAVSSAMGRHSISTTNALLAALNLGLGVWLPNPHYIDHQPADPRLRFARKRITYLGKEIFGLYDLREPYVYVTDGGHWENLGLVELLRRGCEQIFCIDASGDPPGSFAGLREALVLAEVECGVTVHIEDGLDRLVADRHTNVAADCVAVGVIRYHHTGQHRRHAGCLPDECSTGVLYFAKAVVSRYAPDSVLTYALQDRRFPGYSTFNQLLSETQFSRLVDLGRTAALRAAALATQLEQAAKVRADQGEPDPASLDPAVADIEPELNRLRWRQPPE